MGQRLVINIVGRSGDIVANMYYHWDGYTMNALQNCIEILSNYKQQPEYLTEIEKVIASCTGINPLTAGFRGLTPDEKEYIQTEIPDIILPAITGKPNRNEGLLAVSQDGIERNENHSEYYAEVNVSKLTCEISDLWWDVSYGVEGYYDEMEYNEYMEEEISDWIQYETYYQQFPEHQLIEIKKEMNLSTARFLYKKLETLSDNYIILPEQRLRMIE